MMRIGQAVLFAFRHAQPGVNGRRFGRGAAALLLCLVLSAGLCLAAVPVSAAAAVTEPYAALLRVGGVEYRIRAYDGSYEGNTYLSLTDLAVALSGSAKQFRFERVVSSTDGEYFSVTMGALPSLPSGGDAAGGYEGTSSVNPYRNMLYLDGALKKYYSWNPQNGDLCLSLTDLQLMLDVTLSGDPHEVLMLDPDRPFLPDPEELRKAGYFDGIDAVYLADSATGEIFFRQNSMPAVPVASLSKLLSYLVLREGMDAGEISMDDTVRISANVERVSRSGDGMVKLNAGEEKPFRELLEAMLVASSNESALALAEHLCGSEKAFVGRMNDRARELGLRTSVMYNCNGLPSYSGGSLPVKRQNRMSAEDLYKLCVILLERYPDITEITSIPLAHMPSLDDYRTANSNPLLYNMQGVTGLKTGSTNKAGYCIAATLPLQDSAGQAHTLVLILLGAETADVRGQASEILLRSAAAKIRAEGNP